MPFSHGIGARSRAKTGASGGGMPTSFRTRSYTGSSSTSGGAGSLAKSAAAAMPFSSRENEFDAFKVGSSSLSLLCPGGRGNVNLGRLPFTRRARFLALKERSNQRPTEVINKEDRSASRKIK